MRFERALRLGLGLGLLVVVLTGCQPGTARSDRVEAGWSRGENVGQAALNNQIGMAVGPQGDQVTLAWVREDRASEEHKLHLARLDRAGQAQIDQDLMIETTNPEQVQIYLGQGGNAHLFWIDGLRSERQLFYVQVDAAGMPITPPTVLSLSGASVSSYSVDQDERGEADAFWASREGPSVGLYHTHINAAGQVSAESQALNIEGFAPAVRCDREGRLHLVWYEEPQFNEYKLRYAIYDALAGSLGPAIDIASFPTGLGLTAHHPALGLTTTEAYVFWSLERRGGGRTEPMAESYWVSFPLGQADKARRPREVGVPPLNHPDHSATLGGLDTGNWVLPSDETLPSTFVYLPSPIRGQLDTLPVAFSVQLDGRTQSIVQIALTLWAESEMKGYQIAARTRSTSLRPVLAADQENLHLAWIDTAGFGRYDVFYASSSPEVRSNLNRIMLSDVLAAVMDLAWGVAQAMSFLPITLVWAFLPLLVVSVYALIRAEDDIARGGPRAALILAILLYVAFKYLFRPSWLTQFPLPHNTPPNVGAVIVYGAPIVISILAGLTTRYYVKRREMASLFPTLAVFVGTDIVLTLLIYVPSILAE